MIFTSLIVSTAINLTIAITTDFAIVKWLWMVSGFILSILWPTLIRMLSENIPQKDLGKSSIAMGTTVATGTLVIYGLSSIYAAFNMLKLAFYTAAFAVMAVLIEGIIGCVKLKSVVFVLVGMIVVNFLASSLNSLVTSIFPLFMRSKVNSGMIAGVINGFCYVGSTISSYGLGVIADGFGWTAVFLTLIGFSLLVCV